MAETPRYIAASMYGPGTESNFSKSGGISNQPTGVKVCYSFIYFICDPIFKVQNKSFTWPTKIGDKLKDSAKLLWGVICSFFKTQYETRGKIYLLFYSLYLNLRWTVEIVVNCWNPFYYINYAQACVVFWIYILWTMLALLFTTIKNRNVCKSPVSLSVINFILCSCYEVYQRLTLEGRTI